MSKQQARVDVQAAIDEAMKLLDAIRVSNAAIRSRTEALILRLSHARDVLDADEPKDGGS